MSKTVDALKGVVSKCMSATGRSPKLGRAVGLQPGADRIRNQSGEDRYKMVFDCRKLARRG